MKAKLTEVLNKLTGLTVAGFGVSLTASTNERQIIYGMLQKLGDRRLIRDYHHGFNFIGVVQSLKIMRNNVTEALSKLNPKSIFCKYLESIRKALHIYQTFVEDEAKSFWPEFPNFESNEEEDIEYRRIMNIAGTNALQAFVTFRRVVTYNLKELSKICDIPLDESLTSNSFLIQDRRIQFLNEEDFEK